MYRKIVKTIHQKAQTKLIVQLNIRQKYTHGHIQVVMFCYLE